LRSPLLGCFFPPLVMQVCVRPRGNIFFPALFLAVPSRACFPSIHSRFPVFIRHQVFATYTVLSTYYQETESVCSVSELLANCFNILWYVQLRPRCRLSDPFPFFSLWVDSESGNMPLHFCDFESLALLYDRFLVHCRSPPRKQLFLSFPLPSAFSSRSFFPLRFLLPPAPPSLFFASRRFCVLVSPPTRSRSPRLPLWSISLPVFYPSLFLLDTFGWSSSLPPPFRNNSEKVSFDCSVLFPFFFFSLSSIGLLVFVVYRDRVHLQGVDPHKTEQSPFVGPACYPLKFEWKAFSAPSPSP